MVVPEAEPLVSDLRLRYDEPARMGVPAHITLLFPFMSRAEVSPEVHGKLERLFASFSGFSFKLASVARFPATSYLAPMPAEPFVELTRAIWRAFPAYPPFSGEFDSIVPHLTVAHGSARDAEAANEELASRLALHREVRSNCRAVSLFERSSERWSLAHVFQLAPAAGT